MFYLTILDANMTNDFWWRQFNTTGGQTFLSDLFNSRLIMNKSGDFNFCEDSSTVLKDYSVPTTFIDVRPSVARRILFDAFPLDVAVNTIRKNSFYENIYTIIAYCWVDFGRQFEMAQTAKRQLRCAKNRATNAAVYLEALLRNVNMTDLSTSSIGILMNTTILSPMMSDAKGQVWINAWMNRRPTSIAEEVSLWDQQGLTHYSIQFQNRFQYGIDDSIDVVNAVGISKSLKITSIPYVHRGITAWTTRNINPAIWNDIITCANFGCDLVRNFNHTLETLGFTWDEAYLSYTSSPGIDLMRATIGPFSNWDTTYVAIPSSVVDLVSAFREILYNQWKSDPMFQNILGAISPATIDIVPSGWSGFNMTYHGGSPYCAPFLSPSPFVQQSFSFEDSCQFPKPFTFTVDKFNTVFASALVSLSQNRLRTICARSIAHENDCTNTLQTILSVLPKVDISSLTSKIHLSIDAVTQLNIQFMQMATQNTTNVVLYQSLLSDPRDDWCLFGWIAVYDWVDGLREVINFEGDKGNFTLLSAQNTYLQMAANPLELSQTASWYFWNSAIYVSVLTSAMVCVVFMYAITIKFDVEGWNLFQFNRVFGSVWIGRPLLLFRGVTAIIVLSTSTATLSTSNSATYFLNFQMPIIERLIVTGESLWILYVMHDFLLPLTSQYSRYYAPMSSLVAFAASFILSHTVPLKSQASTLRNCSITSFRHGVECTSGAVDIGSTSRIEIFLGIQIASLVGSYIAVRAYWYKSRMEAAPASNLLIPAAVDSYFVKGTETMWQLDSVACVLAGMLPLKKILLDLKIWTVVRRRERSGHSFLGAQLSHKAVDATRGVPILYSNRHAWFGGFSLLYMASSIGSSYAFLEVTKSAMINDFWWASFDANTQVYLSNWFNQNLLLTNFLKNIELTDTAYGALTTSTNSTVSTLKVAPLYASSIQDETNSLSNVIESLRKMDGCKAPWIMTVYCYVDFNKRWEMASSSKKQQRCNDDINNGAIYLESILRNVALQKLSVCWETSLSIGIYSVLKTTIDGSNWLAQTQSQTSSIADEVTYWSKFNITRYTTQWQNYKSIGVIESFSIQNSLGWKYPLTLKSSNGSYQFSAQTSLKMVSPLAGDLLLVASNSSIIRGKSLIRDSPAFAYSNTTLETLLIEVGYLSSPIGLGLSLVRDTFGPFGSITMKRISCPASLRHLFQNITQTLTRLLSSNSDIQTDFWQLYSTYITGPRPKAWDSYFLLGGNPLCEIGSMKVLNSAPWVFFGAKGGCGFNLLETLVGDSKLMVSGLVTLKSINATAISQREVQAPAGMLPAVTAAAAFLQKYFPPAAAKELQVQSESVKAYIRDQIQVEMMQYTVPDNSTDYTLSHINYFDPGESDFEFFAWLYMFDWVQGVREVVTFQGDKNKLTLLSSSTNFIEMPGNPMEIPVNISYYMRLLLQYITWIMLCVACIVCCYILGLKARIEAANMTSFSRVTALVWIGRPLIMLRALSAVCLLATSTLTLTRPLGGLVSYFISLPQPWYIIILTAGELVWMVYIVNDVFSIFTKEYTQEYSLNSFILVWLSSAIWGLAAPVSRSVEINRECSVDQVDFQLVCHAGVVAIGSLGRFYSLIALVLGCSFGCYVFQRAFHPKRQSQLRPSSLFLYAAAKHQFRSSKWQHHGIQYLDKASAVLTGILSLEVGRTLYLFDIKTWRSYSIVLPNRIEGTPQHLIHAIPLLE
ncbi:hypothetical protein Ae201684_015236 [Aphanomyces euteiches]|uniref:Uncharacterized protein n=2 Tax=Aphanomyces euteiches TaxID=100861 RepID=A0A6G0WHF0_9STRA|nr:hypothetical protein Ae201684_015236 [Aphanomyces euteiches]